jgi:hypothetical protein
MSRSRHRRIRDRLRTASQPPAPRSDALGQALDAVNAWGFLEDLVLRDPKAINCFGPGVFRGLLPVSWVGVCLWYRQRGYYHYRTLHLLGIWAVQAAEIRLLVGTKALAYSQPVFNAEAYFFRIQREFRTFYADDGSPPPEADCLYTSSYDPALRLATRQAIETALAGWLQAHDRPAAST